MERRLWLNGHLYKDHLLIDGGEDRSPHNMFGVRLKCSLLTIPSASVEFDSTIFTHFCKDHAAH